MANVFLNMQVTSHLRAISKFDSPVGTLFLRLSFVL